MRHMDDLAPLFQDIAFNERFRGYDVAEVDAYIDRVAKAAALVQGRIAELQRRADAAEAHTSGSSGAGPVEAGEESLTKMLVLAQRTADAAIDEAQAEAAEIRRQADDHASLVVAEAETDRRRMLAEAEAAVEESVRTERERVAAEVAELERYRAFLTDDIAILERHLEQARNVLGSSAAALQHLLDDPEQFRLPAMPATSGVVAPADIETPKDTDAEIADPVVIEAIDSSASAPEPASESEITQAIEVVVIADEAASDGVAETASVEEEQVTTLELLAEDTPQPTDEAAEADVFTFAPSPMPDSEPTSLTVADEAPAFDTPDEVAVVESDGAEPSTASAPPLLITSADLEEVPPSDEPPLFDEPEADASSGAFLEQLRDAASSEGSDEFGEDALATFFDDREDDGGRSWFNRRR
jgi:DivIVA domain-containing protein